MKKKITIADKDLNQLVVIADCSSALYQDRGTKLGEQNLLSDTAVTFKVYVCARNAERQMLCDKDPKDSVAMVLPITTHLYIDSIKVENAYKRRGIATGMLDFAVSLALPETIGLFCANEDAEMKAMLKTLKFTQSPLKAQNMPWKEKFFYYKRLKRLAR